MPTRRTFLLGALSAAVVSACSKAAHHVTGGSGNGQASPTPAPPTIPAPTGPAQYVPNGPRNRSAVALTFHGAGDPALTMQLLDLTARLRAPITVFAVGTWLEHNPDISGRILSAGHELANHTYTHPSLGRLGPLAVSQEISRCRDVLVAQAGNNGRWFRPSGVESQPSSLILDEAGKAGYATVVGFDVDPIDYQDPGASTVVSRVSAGVRSGSIVSLHLGHPGTVAAFERIVGVLRARGLAPVVVRDLLR